MRHRLATILNASVENVDVFTILHSPHNANTTQLDVRFSAHGSPYYEPERINAAIDKHQAEVREKTNFCYLRGYYTHMCSLRLTNVAQRSKLVFNRTTLVP